MHNSNTARTKLPKIKKKFTQPAIEPGDRYYHNYKMLVAHRRRTDPQFDMLMHEIERASNASLLKHDMLLVTCTKYTGRLHIAVAAASRIGALSAVGGVGVVPRVAEHLLERYSKNIKLEYYRDIPQLEFYPATIVFEYKFT